MEVIGEGTDVYPQGSQPHGLYGRSSNQEPVQIPQTSSIEVDDYVFYALRKVK